MMPKLESIFRYKEYDCVIVSFTNNSDLFLFQNWCPTKYYCGYVRVPYWHPVYEKNYNDIEIQCHGGLTFSDHKLLGTSYLGWWIGFDCAHYDDVDNPKDMDFVRQECRNIVDQLQQMED